MELLRAGKAFLRKDLLENLDDESPVYLLAYSDYGGTPYDQANIKYILDNPSCYEDGIDYVHTLTPYYGEIMYIIREDLVNEISKKLDEYPILDDDVYYGLENEATYKDSIQFLKEHNLSTKLYDISEIHDIFRDNLRYNNSFNNVDYSEKEILNKINNYVFETLINPLLIGD